MSESIRILYMEDNAGDRALVREALAVKPGGFTLTVAGTRNEFADSLKRDLFDLVLSDLNIPGFTGLEALAMVHQQNPLTPVIIITGAGSEELAVESLKRGAADYVLKTAEHLQRLPQVILGALERRRLQREAALVADALTQSEAKFRSAFELAGPGMALVTLDGQFLQVNRALVNMLGHSEASLLATTFSAVLHPEDLKRSLPRREELLSSDPYLAQNEGRFFHKTGKIVWVLLNTTLVRDSGHRPLYLIVQAQDITELKHLEEKLRQSQKMEAIGRLAGGVAHDFNNILAVILGYANLIGSELAPGDPQRDNLDQIIQSSERATSLTRQLLAFSRKQVLAPVPMDLNAVVSGMQQLLGRLIGADVQLGIAGDSQLGTIKADPGQIQQILINLAVNARDAMPKGGRLAIKMENVTLIVGDEPSTLPPGEYVMLSIGDTGHGMSEDVRAHLYEPFYTTKEVGKGTGLGLSTVYGIVHQHKGAIECVSEEGRGTTFKIWFSRIREAPPKEALAGNIPGAARGAETVLVVEDEESLRGLAKIILEKQGYEVLTAFDGQHALEVCQEFPRPIHLLLTDVVMPRLSGTELARQITRHQPAIKVLYTSGYTENVVLLNGIEDAELAFLQKPYSPLKLLEKVRELLDQKPKS